MTDPVEIALTIASLAVAAALVVVTYYLVRITRNLADATRHLADATQVLRLIEERKERAEARRRRITRLKRKIELTQTVLGWDYHLLRQHLDQGTFPDPEGNVIRELATLFEYGTDHANKELVEGLISVLDIVARRIKLEPVPAASFFDHLGHLAKLAGDIPRWESDLMALSIEENAALAELDGAIP